MKIEFIEFENMFKLPERKRKVGDSGYDVYAKEDAIIPPHSTVKIPLGFGMKIPVGFTAYLHDRTGNFMRGIMTSNALIDNNYRGEVHAVLCNITDEVIEIKRGERPCSLVLVPNEDIEWITKEEAEEIEKALNGEERGDKGFGSSGK